MSKKFRTQFDSRVVHKSFKDVVSMTDPQYEHDCTIEGIIKKYGVLPRPEVEPVNMDVSEMGDFAACMERVNEGLSSFAALPSEIRDRFGNDPKAFMSFLADPSNVKEAIRLGLMVELKPKESAVDVLKDIKDVLNKPVTAVAENQA